MTDSALVQQLFDNFAANPFTGSRINNTPQELAAFDPNGNPRPQGWIQEGAIDIATFAATIRPVVLVHGLPTLPDASYPVGQFVYNLDESPARLYKNEADAWVAAIGPDDIQANSITAGQIAAGAVSTSELAVGARLTGEVANESGATPGVFIDSSGILIRDGKLTLQDEFGATSMSASGFSGSWGDFVKLGLYNGSFRAGTAGTVPNGRTSALPYWTVADNVGTGGTVTFLAPGVKFTWGAATDRVEIASDLVPVLPGETLEGKIAATLTAVAGSVAFQCSIRTYDEAGSSVGEDLFSLAGTAGTTAFDVYRSKYDVPEGVYFVQLVIETWETSHNAGNKIDVWHAGLTSNPMTLGEVLVRGQLRATSTGAFAFASPLDSGQTDAAISYAGSGVLSIDDGASANLALLDILADEVDVAGAVVATGDITAAGINSTGLWNIGSSTFPASPSLGDVYYRTDATMWFRYDGVRWRCLCLHTADFNSMTIVQPLSATSTNHQRVALPVGVGLDIRIESYDCLFFVTGGTALGASHKWVGTVLNRPAGTTLGTLTIDSGASDAWRGVSDTTAALVDLTSSQAGLSLTWTKTGTPGTLLASVSVTYRFTLP